jgi:hypothetical protein
VYAHFIERPENLQGTAECAMRVNSLAVIQLEHNLGLALRLCAFHLHHLLKAVFDRHEYERKPTEILHSQGRLGQDYHINPSDELIR